MTAMSFGNVEISQESGTRAKAEDDALDDLADQGIQGDSLELAVGGNGDKALHRGEDDEREPRGIARDNFACRLTFREGGMGVRKGSFTGFQ